MLISALRVLWALDPFEDIGSSQKNAAQFIREFVKSEQVAVTPATVQSLPTDLSSSASSRWEGHFRTFFENAVKITLKELRVKQTESPQIVFEESTLIPERVKALLIYVERSKSDLIIITTRKKLGLRKIIGDSFAETLIYESRVPVLIFGPASHTFKGREHILFPSDFSTGSHRLFRNVLQLASQIHARVTLFHAIERIPQQNWSGPHLDLVAYNNLQDPRKIKDPSLAEALAHRWMREAKTFGIQSNSLIIETKGNVASEILAASRRTGISLIAMQDKSSAVSAHIIGSNTRQVVRNAPCPVLVLKIGKRASLQPVKRKAA